MLNEVIISILSHYRLTDCWFHFQPSQLTGYLSWWSRDSRQTPYLWFRCCLNCYAFFDNCCSWFIDCIRPNIFFVKLHSFYALLYGADEANCMAAVYRFTFFWLCWRLFAVKNALKLSSLRDHEAPWLDLAPESQWSPFWKVIITNTITVIIITVIIIIIKM